MKEELLFFDGDPNIEIYQVDETVFIGADHQARAWSQRNNNVVLGLDGTQEA